MEKARVYKYNILTNVREVWRFSFQSESVDEVRQAVYWAIQAGYRHIDTAAIYFDEEQVGQGIAQAIADKLITRNDIFVTTKV